MERLAIIGAGELGSQAAHFAKQTNQYNIIGWFDDFQKKETIINGYPVLGKIPDIESCFKMGLFDSLFIAIGYKYLEFKKELFNKHKENIPFATIIHKSSIIDYTAKIGAGVIIYPGCIIDKEVIIEDNVLVNLGCIISHNTVINSHCFIAPGVCIAGFVEVGECSMLGINSTIIDNINIGTKCILGANSTVINNITGSGKYIGSPAKLMA